METNPIGYNPILLLAFAFFATTSVSASVTLADYTAGPLGSNRLEVGIPMVVGYETKNARLYPPEGLFLDATAIYDRSPRGSRFLLLSQGTAVTLKGRTYALAANHTAAGNHLKLRAKRLAKSGFTSMIRPFSMLRKPQIYLLDPYDPNKMPLLMVHGLQSTRVAFAALVNALRADPVIRSGYQIWQFYYASGTPCSLTLRSSGTVLRERPKRLIQSTMTELAGELSSWVTAWVASSRTH